LAYLYPFVDIGVFYTRGLTNGIADACDACHIVAKITEFQGILN